MRKYWWRNLFFLLFFFFSPSSPSPSLSLVLSFLTSINCSLAKINLLFHYYYLISTQIFIFKPDFQVCPFVPFLCFHRSSTSRNCLISKPKLSFRTYLILLGFIISARDNLGFTRKWSLSAPGVEQLPQKRKRTITSAGAAITSLKAVSPARK